MSQGDFTNVHIHSDGSIMDSPVTIDRLLDTIQAKGMKTTALTDHGSMINTVDFFKGAKARGIKPIIGMESYVCKDGLASRPTKTKSNEVAIAIESEDTVDPTVKNTSLGNSHIVLLAKNETGYHNLCKMTEIAHRDGFYRHPRIDYDVLRNHKEGIIVTTACMFGDFSKLVKYDRLDEAKRFAADMVDTFGDDFYIELQYHGFDDQAKYIPTALKIAKEVGANIVATQDVHYAKPEDWELQDSLFCIGQGLMLNSEDRKRKACKQMYVKDRDEMEAYLMPRGVPKIAFDNTMVIADKVQQYELQPKNYLLPQQFGKTVIQDKLAADKYLREMCRKGWKDKIALKVKDNEDKKKLYQGRVNWELSVISSSGFSSYFLIVQDFVNNARTNGKRVGPGRGSAAGCLVSYLIGITGLDPIEYGLLFERFLVPGRPSMPDIDIDVSDRDYVVNYLEETYGRDKVSPILNRTEITAKNGLIKVSGILGDRKLGESLSKTIEKERGETPSFSEVLATVDEIKVAHEKYPKLFEIAQGLEGTTIGLMGHASGVIISPVPLSDVIPLHSYKGTMYTAFDKSQIEYVKMVKLDILGIDQLLTFDNSIKLINERHHRAIDIDSIPIDDQFIYAKISDGDTMGVFQFESALMIDILRTVKPANILELAACNAMGRPGALDGDGIVKHYADRKFGDEPVAYDHPVLEPILKETYGLMIYQEQIMTIAREMCSFTYTDVDEFRKCFSYKDKSIMERNKEKFIKGAIANGYEEALATKIFGDIEKFAGYGFNKSHAVAYAYVAYQTAWLKGYYPLEYIVSCLNTQVYVGKPQEDIVKFVIDLENHGYTLTLPDINKSESTCFKISDELDKNGKTVVYYALGAVKGVAQGDVDDWIKLRPFTSLQQALLKAIQAGCNSKNVGLLAQVGALRLLAKNTPYVVETMADRLDVLKRAVGSAKKKHETQLAKFQKMQERLSGQEDLFGAPKSIPEPNWNDWKLYRDFFDERFTETQDINAEPVDFKNQDVKWQMELIGYTVNGTLLDEYADLIRAKAEMVVSYWNQEGAVKEGEQKKVAGMLMAIRTMNDRNGNKMAFATISDGRSEARVVIFKGLYNKYQESTWSSRAGHKVIVVDGLKSKGSLVAKNITFLTKDSDPNEETKETSTTPVKLRGPNRPGKPGVSAQNSSEV